MRKILLYAGVFLLLVVATTLVTVVSANVRGPFRRSQGEAIHPSLVDRTATPIRFATHPLSGFSLAPADRFLLLEKTSTWGRIKSSEVSVQIHLLRLRNLWHAFGDESSRSLCDQLMESLLNAQEYRKRGGTFSILFDTPYGAAYRIKMLGSPLGESVDGMTHVDKLLSVMGELGYGLDVEIVTHSGRKGTLADILEDSLKRWKPGRESDWTLIAYCSYLRNQRSWVDGDGQLRSVDDVLASILARKTPGPCFGTHHLYGVARACMRERATPGFFSRDLIAQAERLLREASRNLERSQSPDGSWSLRWNGGSHAGENSQHDMEIDPRLYVVVTGHMLEWFAMVDPDLRPNAAVVGKGARYVLERLRVEPERHFNGPFLTGVTHAVRGLLNLDDSIIAETTIGVLR